MSSNSTCSICTYISREALNIVWRFWAVGKPQSLELISCCNCNVANINGLIKLQAGHDEVLLPSSKQ